MPDKWKQCGIKSAQIIKHVWNPKLASTCPLQTANQRKNLAKSGIMYSHLWFGLVYDHVWFLSAWLILQDMGRGCVCFSPSFNPTRRALRNVERWDKAKQSIKLPASFSTPSTEQIPPVAVLESSVMRIEGHHSAFTWILSSCWWQLAPGHRAAASQVNSFQLRTSPPELNVTLSQASAPMKDENWYATKHKTTAAKGTLPWPRAGTSAPSHQVVPAELPSLAKALRPREWHRCSIEMVSLAVKGFSAGDGGVSMVTVEREERPMQVHRVQQKLHKSSSCFAYITFCWGIWAGNTDQRILGKIQHHLLFPNLKVKVKSAPSR